jgi:heme exporter protein C
MKTAVYKTPAVPPWLAALAGGMMLVLLYLIFIWVPMERTMGVVQRIFYFHVPSAIVAFTAFTIGGIAAIQFLATRKNSYDDLSVAANEAGLIFAVINLLTGMLWARPIWGVYWAWDGRLETMLLLTLIYAAYLILRQSVSEPTQRAVVCAVTSIFGMVDIPIVYMANRWWRTQHPGPVLFSSEGSLDPRMEFVLFFGIFAQLCILWVLVRMRRRIEDLRREADGLRREVHSL